MRSKATQTAPTFYLPKPVDPAELVAALKSHIARRQLERINNRGLQLDPAQLILAGPKGKTRLATSEVRLLLALARAQDRTLERWQILAHVSTNDEISVDNLQNRLSQLRRKIAGCGVDGESIKAIRGIGYRLCIDLVIT
jgi:DNA-binding response OmpR family regulator